VQAAHAVAHVFPAGQLYADLGAPGRAGAEPGRVLAGFLRALGQSSVPGTLPELERACRAAFTGRRVLVVLDDAQDATRTRQLLSALQGCAVLITTQRRMIDLPGTRWFEIDELRPDESISLLERAVGTDRLSADPAGTERPVAAVSGYPPAVRAAGARLVARPGWAITAMVGQLEEELTRPVIGHPDCAVVEAPFELAYSRLDAEQALVFRRAALSDGPDVSAATAAMLAEVPGSRALFQLESLADLHLVRAEAFGRYRYNPLVKLFARRKALAEHDRPSRRSTFEPSAGNAHSEAPNALSSAARPQGGNALQRSVGHRVGTHHAYPQNPSVH
jgi:hypothetical protein